MSKELAFEMQEELWATVKMPFELYQSLKTEEIKLLSVKDESINYSKNKEWRDANATLKEAIIHRKGIEEEIRAEILSNNETRRDIK